MSLTTIALTRRQVLVGGAAGTLALSLYRLAPAVTGGDAPRRQRRLRRLRHSPSIAPGRMSTAPSGSGTASCAARTCAPTASAPAPSILYVKDGMVWREEQADVYARQAAGLPDYAPRGCQKANCYSSLMVRARPHHLSARTRRRARLRAVGAHLVGRGVDARRRRDARCGAGEWRRDRHLHNGTSNIDWGRARSATCAYRPARCDDARRLRRHRRSGDGRDRDLARRSSTAAPTNRADTLFLLHSNLIATRIPDAHFITEHATTVPLSSLSRPLLAQRGARVAAGSNPRPMMPRWRSAWCVCCSSAMLSRCVRARADGPAVPGARRHRPFPRQSDPARDGRDATSTRGLRPAKSGRGAKMRQMERLVDVGPTSCGALRLLRGQAARAVVLRPVMDRLRAARRRWTRAGARHAGLPALGRVRRASPSSSPRRRDAIYATWGSCKSYTGPDPLSAGSSGLPRCAASTARPARCASRREAAVRRRRRTARRAAHVAAAPGVGVYTPPPRAMENAIAEALRRV